MLIVAILAVVTGLSILARLAVIVMEVALQAVNSGIMPPYRGEMEAMESIVESCGRGVDLLAHSSAIEIDDIPKDFSPHRAVRAHETDFYLEDSIVGNIPLAYIFVSSVMLELRFK